MTISYNHNAFYTLKPAQRSIKIESNKSAELTNQFNSKRAIYTKPDTYYAKYYTGKPFTNNASEVKLENGPMLLARIVDHGAHRSEHIKNCLCLTKSGAEVYIDINFSFHLPHKNVNQFFKLTTDSPQRGLEQGLYTITRRIISQKNDEYFQSSPLEITTQLENKIIEGIKYLKNTYASNNIINEYTQATKIIACSGIELTNLKVNIVKYK